ncbi:MAG: DUF368 domain-containing protein [Treponema sp.]|nr:DUF368 domain-containing protein [Treponema sp.]
MKDFIKVFLCSILVGIANVIPGVSGGTLIVVFNLYDRLVNSITLNVKKLWENKWFLLSVILGMGTGILGFSKVVTVLYEKFPCQTSCCFTGLVIGSIPMLFRMVFKKSGDDGIQDSEEHEDKNDSCRKEKSPNIFILILFIVLGFAVMTVFYFLNGKFGINETMTSGLPSFSFTLAVKMFTAGFVAAVAMIIPGISGSLIMVAIGIYPVVMSAIDGLTGGSFSASFIFLFPFGIGVLMGIVSGILFIKWILKRVPNFTYAVILGLIAGSVLTVFPGSCVFENFIIALTSLLFLGLGFAISFFSNFFSGNNK